MARDYIRQPRILVVDDDPATCRLIDTLLSSIGCQVESAGDGYAGVERIENGQWDTVLLDINMPGLDGLGALEKIRAIHSKEKLPVIIVTGQDDVETRLKALELQANDFLAKPIDQPELLARIGTTLSLYWAQREIEEMRRESANQLGNVLEELKVLLGEVQTNVKSAMNQLAGDPATALKPLKDAMAATERATVFVADATRAAGERE